ncbi:MAG: hypothetical protein ACK5BL_08650 [Flavobacteriales bacterium]|jgi:hypothetical protein
MENKRASIDDVITHAEDYLKTRQRLTQHVVTEKVIVLSASLITAYVLFSFFMMSAFFASWALAGWISQRMNDAFAGYWIVAGGYACVALLFLLMRNTWLKNPLMNTMVNNIYNNPNEQND